MIDLHFSCYFNRFFVQILRQEKLAGRVSGSSSGPGWSSIVHVVMVQALKLMAMDAGGTSSDPYCKIVLG